MGVLRKGQGAPTWPKNAIMALISELLSADLSSDALAMINIENKHKVLIDA